MEGFNFLQKDAFNQGLKKYENTKGAVLIDVRTPEEYSEGRVPGSKNIPLHEINKITEQITNKNIPLFIYCLSGARSSQAKESLKHMGYTDITNLGGINHYHGEIEK